MKQTGDYTVIFSDDDIVVLNKRPGLCVAADRFDPDAPRLDLLAQNEFGRLFAVHRIDKDTSGIVIYARTENAHKNLCGQFEKRLVHKTYHCLVHGRPLWQQTKVTLPLMPDGDANHRTTINRKDGKKSETDFEFIGSCGPYSWIKAMPRTGRTHQIRVHLSANSLPIVCDPLYGTNRRGVYLSELKRRYNGDTFEERPLINRLVLHAYKTELSHPVTGEKISFTAEYPRDLEATRKQLSKIFGTDPLRQVETAGSKNGEA